MKNSVTKEENKKESIWNDAWLQKSPKPTTQAEVQLKEIIKKHSKSFYFASSFLPKQKKLAIWSLYAFCRATDDLADENPNANINELDLWTEELQNKNSQVSVINCFQQTVASYKIPIQYALDLIAGCKRDLQQNTYKDFEELSQYCYQVASTVGIMSCYILGFKQAREAEVIDNAIKAGIALQMTNILRDVKEDLEKGRIYLPKDSFEKFGCSYSNPKSWPQNSNFQNLVRFEVKRAHDMYESSRSSIKHLSFDGRFAIHAALTVYEAILQKIELNKFDVFGQRVHLNKWEKVLLLPKILWQAFIP